MKSKRKIGISCKSKKMPNCKKGDMFFVKKKMENKSGKKVKYEFQSPKQSGYVIVIPFLPIFSGLSALKSLGLGYFKRN